MREQLRILALVGSRVLYGQERANLLVLETMKQQGAEILAIVEDRPEFRIVPNELSRRGIAFAEVPYIGTRQRGFLFDFIFGNPVRYLRGRRQLQKIIAEFRPTHIHVPNPFAFLMADSVARDVPIIYRIGDKPATHNALWRWIWKRVRSRVTHFVADSEFIAHELRKLSIPKHRYSVVYTAPSQRAQPPTPNRSPDPNQILFIGQLTADKGVDRLIEAFRLVAPEFPAATLTVAGRISEWSGDDWARDLRNATLRDPLLRTRVLFPGEIDDVYGYLSSAGFLAVPSVWEEPFGLVVGEAKAAARPAVVFPRGGLPEQIAHGTDGYVCRDTSAEALADGLRYYLRDQDKLRAHGRAALASLKNLGAANFSSRWCQVYRSTSK